ncbi:MAG TPA: Gfo/Idh/MocA family oxidoreductase [Agriterribacter sp.]|nr:Gfo/Idh/MocA family oxidoreductase [Agriterribacter sp.]HRQ49891.1 Gfo/Idh/MocA family oxidoreductase [Agriterribacter sp.]
MLKGVIIGTGFWSNFQIPAWQELKGVKITGLYNRTFEKAKAIGEKFGIRNIYDNAETLLEKEQPDFVDIITDVDTHAHFTKLAAERRIDVICQKPMAPSLQLAKDMLEVCKANGVRLFIHENFRWQLPVRKLKETLDSGVIGRAFKARVSFCSAFPVFDNQPFLKSLDHFILTDIGSHVLDICRFLFGEAKNLFCVTQRVNAGIKGEDVANVLMEMQSGLHCYAEMSYASVMEKEAFPQTLVFIEGESGALYLTNDFELKIIKQDGTTSTIIQPVMYNWLDPGYAVVHSSIVDCNRNILQGLQGGNAETTGDDNLKTVKLVWAAYASAATGKAIHF